MENVRTTVSNILKEFDKVVVGYDDPKRKIILALIADVHVLLESVPGLAKTLLIETLQQIVSGTTHERIQFTPDLKPTDITGTRVPNQLTKAFEDEVGPIMANFVLADELNRAPGKTQSALLSPMQERKFKIGKNLYKLPNPFLVLATMNPLEQEGVFPLPEAQLDRFALKIILDYVSEDDELSMLENTALEDRDAHLLVSPVLSGADIVAMRKEIKEKVYVSRALLRYVIALVRATRPGSKHFNDIVAKPEGRVLKELVKVGASPRALQTFVKLTRVRAAMQGRDFVLPEDVRALAYDVLRHRIALTDDAVFDEKKTDEAIDIILKLTPIVDDEGLYKRR
jgi:MoxR-like ATPase